MWLWLLIVVALGVAQLTESRRYKRFYYVEDCRPPGVAGDHDNTELEFGTILIVEFTNKSSGALLDLESAKGCGWVFEYTGEGGPMGVHLVGSDTLTEAQLDTNLRKYFPTDPNMDLEYTLTTDSGESVEKITIKTIDSASPRDTTGKIPSTNIKFKLTGNYVYNNFQVPKWRIVHMIWSVNNTLYDDIIDKSKDKLIPLRNASCPKTFTHKINDPTTTYIHHHERPVDMIDITDCQVDIVPSNDSYALQYRALTNTTDVIQYMANETITMSYKPTYTSPYQVFRTYKKESALPAMIDTPLPDNLTGVYGIRYKFATNGVKRALFSGLMFSIGTILDPIKPTGATREMVHTSTAVETETPPTPPPTEEPSTRPTTTPSTPPLPPPDDEPLAVKSGDVTESDSNLLPLYVVVALLALVAIVALAAYVSKWNGSHWQPNRVQHNQFDMNNRKDAIRIYGDNNIQLKSAAVVTKHA